MVMTALVWGLFMGVSSNLRYQARLPRCHLYKDFFVAASKKVWVHVRSSNCRRGW